MIPKDLGEAISELDERFPDEEKEFITSNPESCMIEYHSNVGRRIRNEWKLWEGGPLKDWFISKGIDHPDDMSGIMLNSYWRYKNQKPLELDKQIKYYQDYWIWAKAAYPNVFNAKA